MARKNAFKKYGITDLYIKDNIFKVPDDQVAEYFTGLLNLINQSNCLKKPADKKLIKFIFELFMTAIRDERADIEQEKMEQEEYEQNNVILFHEIYNINDEHTKH